jgi:formylglycine-generating enzyme required for sulfatase activity
MKRVLFVTLFVLACGKSGAHVSLGSAQGSGSSGGSEALVVAVADAGSAGSASVSDEPTEPPPPPIVKAGGKGDCKTDYAPKPTRDPNPMCKVDGGTFTMGDDNERMAAKLSPYYIDQFEVTAAQVAFFLNATHGTYACTEFKGFQEPCLYLPSVEALPSNQDYIEMRAGKYVPIHGYDHSPFIHATRAAAEAYCAWAGKKLPTEAQWEFAARHDPTTNKDYIYPWGDKFDPTRLRCRSTLCKGPDELQPVAVGTYDGANGHRDGRSPWGLFDMAGNAAEFVLGCLNDYHPCKGGPCVDPPGEPARKKQPCDYIARGDDYLGTTADELTTSRRERSPGEDGFRCAR